MKHLRDGGFWCHPASDPYRSQLEQCGRRLSHFLFRVLHARHAIAALWTRSTATGVGLMERTTKNFS
jgi:hypothetical protein